MIDEEGKRHKLPAAPLIPAHMLDGFNAVQRKALGITAEQVKADQPIEAPKPDAKKK